MCRKLICLFSVVFVLTLVCTSYADIVIGDFEDGTEGWVATNGTSIDTSDIGATLGSKSLVISDVPANNFTWAVQREGLVDMTNCTTISVDITWVAAEWDPQEGIWVNFKDMARRSIYQPTWSIRIGLVAGILPTGAIRRGPLHMTSRVMTQPVPRSCR